MKICKEIAIGQRLPHNLRVCERSYVPSDDLHIVHVYILFDIKREGKSPKLHRPWKVLTTVASWKPDTLRIKR